ncbi:hypothetical protein BDV26DRAFT_263731 [Aspergillus bertholletiae]|uniref:Uncharacterized protein n=1 Tax=Aspergillus bertholletiae TaxID=1226010 RepID=A0A5N7B778_9EURO|nr:hypothetical protein BDV26DRAFT_263731 [Aspergillus bertholletiae]
MPSIAVLPHNSTTPSSSSFTTSISTNSLTSKINSNTHHHHHHHHHHQQQLTRRPTLTSLTRWVSRKMSRQRLRNNGSSSHDRDLAEGMSDSEEDRATEDDYAAWCWAFSEGRTDSHSRGDYGLNQTRSPGYEHDEYEYDDDKEKEEKDYGRYLDQERMGSYRGQENGDVFAGFDGQGAGNGKYYNYNNNNYYYDRAVPTTSVDQGRAGGEAPPEPGHEAEGNMTNTRGKYAFLRSGQDDRLGPQQSSDSVPADQLVRFTSIGHYGYSPLAAGLPVSPPPRILTPARYAETNRMEREKSEELKQKAQKGFWGPVRALWLSLRRSR